MPADKFFHVCRFHPLPEFDEGKRSCRRRLEGHNRRRRKTQPDSAARDYLMGEEDLIGKDGAGLVGGLLNILARLQGRTQKCLSGPLFFLIVDPSFVYFLHSVSAGCHPVCIVLKEFGRLSE
jgi:hypothetical protein